MDIEITLKGVINSIKQGDYSPINQLNKKSMENPPVNIDWSLAYDDSRKVITAEFHISVLPKNGSIPFLVCYFKKEDQEIACRMDTPPGVCSSIAGWLYREYDSPGPVEIKATVFGWVNVPDEQSQLFKFDKVISIE